MSRTERLPVSRAKPQSRPDSGWMRGFCLRAFWEPKFGVSHDADDRNRNLSFKWWTFIWMEIWAMKIRTERCRLLIGVERVHGGSEAFRAPRLQTAPVVFSARYKTRCFSQRKRSAGERVDVSALWYLSVFFVFSDTRLLFPSSLPLKHTWATETLSAVCSPRCCEWEEFASNQQTGLQMRH